jgi:outer membrane lipopolysaccharide assembly protein LptE/RlpB
MIFFAQRNMDSISKNYRRAFTSVVAVVTMLLCLHACGFQLRGSIELSEDISPIYLEQNSMFDLAREIRSLLKINKIKIVKDAKLSKAQLILQSEENTRRVLSVDGSGRAREYLLSYKINFIIKTKQSEPAALESTGAKNKEAADIGIENIETENLTEKINQDLISPDSISPDSISVARSLLFDPGAVLAVSNEAEILYKDMRRDAARLILLKLQARSINHAGKNTNAASTEVESSNKQ